jgi:hypothetical protein
VLSRYSAMIAARDYEMYLVVNANRPLSASVPAVLGHLAAIEEQSRLKVSALINNTHMLRETTVEDILRGQELCLAVAGEAGIPIAFNVAPKNLNLGEIGGIMNRLFRIEMYMRPQWL